MNNYSRMTFIALSFVFLFALVSTVSAAHPYNTYTYTDRDSFSYNENDNGFRISSSERDNYGYGNRGYTRCGEIYSWRSYGCGSRYYADRPYYPDHVSYGYDQDMAIKEAFKTYQQRSKQEYQLEVRRIGLEERRRYSYGGYGYGYSGRVYSYG